MAKGPQAALPGAWIAAALAVLPWAAPGIASAAPLLPLQAPTATGGPLTVEGRALSGNYLFEVIKRSKPHADRLAALLRGERKLPPWVRNMVSRGNYVSGASIAVTIDGQPMELFSACEAHNCIASELKLLMSPDGKTIYLRMRDDKLGETILGDPPASALPFLRKNGL